MSDLGLFLFLGAGAVALFAFLSVAHWTNSQVAERIARERLALFRKLAESPSETAALVLAELREDEVRRAQEKRVKARRARRDSRQGGLILAAVGVGRAVFLQAVAPGEGVWTIGIIPLLIGMVTFGFTCLREPDDPVV